jgi:hypothetical protein
MAGGAGRNEFKMIHNDLQSSRKYHTEFGLTGLKDSISYILPASKSNYVILGLLNGDIFKFSYDLNEDEHACNSLENLSIDELADQQEEKLLNTKI